jgi:hypothetical protein
MSRLRAEVLADLAFWGRTMQRAAERGETLDAASLAEAAAVILEAHASTVTARASDQPEATRERKRRSRAKKRAASSGHEVTRVLRDMRDTRDHAAGDPDTRSDVTTVTQVTRDLVTSRDIVTESDASRARVSSSSKSTGKSNSNSAVTPSPSAQAMARGAIDDERGEDAATSEGSTGANDNGNDAAPKPASPADKAAPWLGGARRVWRDHYGGDLPAQAVRALRPVVARIGEADMLVRLTAYCDRTEARFVDLWRFASTVGSWGPDDGAGTPGDAETAVALDAAITTAAHRLWAAFKATAILRAQTSGQYEHAAHEIVASGAVATIDALRTIWAALDRQRLLDAQTDAYAERHLADVLRLVWRDLAPSGSVSPIPCAPAAA